MNRRRITRILACLTALALCAPAMASGASTQGVTTQAIPVFTITGTGYGHGIGLSQYGAQGAALAGKTYDWILKHYFQGTTLGTVDTSKTTVKVDLDKSAVPRSSWTLRAVGVKLRVYDSTHSADLAASTYFTFTRVAGTTLVKNSSGTVVWKSTEASVKAYPLNGTRFEIADAAGPYVSTSKPTPTEWRGKIELAAGGTTTLYARNWLNMQQYLYGVVPCESPASWKTEALKAQAVAARSYAWSKVSAGTVLKCTTLDQVYGGYSHEAASTNAVVDATKDQMVKYGSTVVQTFFFSQDGGHTANIEDVWTSATAKPYYTGVSDPYEALASPGYCPWPTTKQRTISGLDLAAALAGLSGVPAGAGSSVWVSGVTVDHASSGHAREVTFRFSDGSSAKVTGDTVRGKLKTNDGKSTLLSTSFSFSGFPIVRIAGTDRYDTAVKTSQLAFTGTTTAPVVVLASGRDYADALAGAGLAGAKKGALLLTEPDSLPAGVKTRLQTLKPATVYLLGGLKVASAVKAALPGATVTSLKGADRYQTALLAAQTAYPTSAPAGTLVVSGTSWADGVSASALAYAKGYPVLLTPGTGLSQYARAFLIQHPTSTILVGGTAVLSGAVATAVSSATGKSVTRVSGADRYATSAALAERCISSEAFTLTDVYLATGASYPDALTGGALAGKLAKPMLLTAPSSVPGGTKSFLTRHRLAISKLHLFGGTSAISAAGASALDAVMMD